VTAEIEDSRKYDVHSSKEEGVKEILQQFDADIYLCGPAAKDYLTEEFLSTIRAKFVWMDYSGYPEYNQLYPPFDHFVSIIDLIFNEGENATNFMKTFSLEDLIKT